MAAKKKVKKTQCPNGHTLPKTGCSPLFCVDGGKGVSDLATTEPEDDGVVSFAQSRKRVRDNLYPVPALSGAEAEEFVEKRKVELAPRALRELEFQLDLGNNKERADAARDILRMNGMLNRDAPIGVAPTINIITNGAEMQLPWLKRKEEKRGEITAAADSGSKSS